MSYVPAPNLTGRGDMNQPNFGLNNGMNFDWGVVNGQPPPTQLNHGRTTHSYAIRGDSVTERVSAGEFMFVKVDTNAVKTPFTIPALRAAFYEARNGHMITSTQPAASMAIYKNKSKGDAFHDLDWIIEHIEVLGVAIGEVEPSTQVGILDYGTSKFAGPVKHIPITIHGHTLFPNIFDRQISAGAHIYMIIKMVPMQESYTDAKGGAHKMIKGSAYPLVPDVIFVVSNNHKQPQYLPSCKELLEGRGEQPPLDSLAYIEWEKVVSGSSTQLKGTLRHGALWMIGKVLHPEAGPNVAANRGAIRKAEPLPFNTVNFGTFPKIEIMLCYRRIFGNA